MKYYSLSVIVAVLFSFVAVHAGEQKSQALEFKQFFKEFHENTKKVMDQVPAKENAVRSSLRSHDVDTKDLMDYKLDQKENILLRSSMRAPIGPFSAIPENNIIEYLVDLKWGAWSSLHQMDQAKLQQGKVKSKTMWSDTYWPTMMGGIAWRYALVGNTPSWDWTRNRQEFLSRPIQQMLSSNQVNKLSPAEKYDLLMGDANYSLTKYAWGQGGPNSAAWEGICHGWALASFMVDRPKRAVTIADVHNQYQITFYPSDIKALASQLYANFGRPIIGGRCDVYNPAKDPTNGRVYDENCNDINPGAWHKAIVNQIGRSQRSFIMDATFDHEVWNHPVTSYNMRYFNPQTGESSWNWRDSGIAPQQFTKDKFKRYRDSRASYIVGVNMTVDYMVEADPYQSHTDSAANDFYNKMHLRYDLEIDASGTIIGGEWYTNAHPDFLWGEPSKQKVKTHYDNKINGQTLEQIVQQGRQFAPLAVRDYGSPLAKVVDKLIERAQR